jgi:para-nitrobenzyl esterase
MPASKGLFQRAIVQSAAATGMIDAAEAERRAECLLRQLGLPPAAGAALDEVPIDDLLDAQAACATAEAWRTGMFFVPVVDGATLPAMPMRAIGEGAGSEVDLLIGTTEQEMRLYTYGLDVGAMTDRHLSAALRAELPGRGRAGSSHAGEPDAEWVLDAYRALREERGEALRPMDLLFAIQSDTRLRLHATQLADRHAASGGARTFMYLFGWRSPMQGGELGSCHALDLPFVFGTLETPGMAAFAGEGDAPRRVSDAMQEAWTAFARSGEPSCEPVGAWPGYDEKRRATVELGVTPRLLEDPFSREREILAGVDFDQFT